MKNNLPKSRAVKYNQPCLDEINCGSSDALTEYDDGHAHCFSCKKSFKLDTTSTAADYQDTPSPKIDGNYTYEFLGWRSITSETMRKFRTATKVLEDGSPHSIGFPYSNGGSIVRLWDQKKFHTHGPISEPGLFGQDVFPAGSTKSVTITEGAPDALSGYQMLGGQHAFVSVRGASSARKDCAAVFDYLNAFDRIILCLDNDDPGRQAAAAIASLFDFNKVFAVALKYKDANDYLHKHKEEKEFRNAWFSAKRFLPEGIVSSHSDFDRIIDDDGEKPSIPYPFLSLNERTLGIREGEFVLVTAPEGIGKTEFIRRLEHHLLVTTTAAIGTIHLEEPKARQLKGLAGIELQAPAHLAGHVSGDEIKSALRRLTEGRDDRLHIYSHFGSDDPDVLLDKIRFMVTACGCKYVFLDHITMIVTGLENDDERRVLDYVSTRLATMCHDLGFTLFCISHVNDDGKTRGSRNISKVANLRIDLSRNLLAELEEERNKTYLTISKNRFAGKTGPAGVLAFDPEAFMLKEAHEVVTLPPTEDKS